MRFKRFFFPFKKSDASLATLYLIRSLSINVTGTTIENTVESHPFYPSLDSISDSLIKWKINNACIEVEENKLNDLPTPFIAHTNYNGGHFFVVTDVKIDITYLDNEGRKKLKSREDFLKEWSHIVLLPYAEPDAGETVYHKKRREEFWRRNYLLVSLGFGFLVILLYGIINFDSGDIWPGILMFLTFIGAFISGVLSWADVTRDNAVLREFCTSEKNTGCNAILNSKAARLFGVIGWSEIGFLYFTGEFIFLLSYYGQPGLSISLFSWINVVALPFIIYSILYQWHARKWCPVCITVQVILIFQMLVCYITNSPYLASFSTFNISLLILAFISFISPLLIWLFIKPLLRKARSADNYKKEVSRLKYNPQLFYSILQNQKKVIEPTEGLGILMGNPEAKHTIIKVCNPYCRPCAKTHSDIEEVLEINNNIKLQIIFTAENNNKDEQATPVKHFMALNDMDDKKLIQKALKDWYAAEVKNYAAFAQKYPVKENLTEYGKKLETMNNWCKKMSIKYTPTFFVDEYEMPKLYNINDMKYFF